MRTLLYTVIVSFSLSSAVSGVLERLEVEGVVVGTTLPDCDEVEVDLFCRGRGRATLLSGVIFSTSISSTGLALVGVSPSIPPDGGIEEGACTAEGAPISPSVSPFLSTSTALPSPSSSPPLLAGIARASPPLPSWLCSPLRLALSSTLLPLLFSTSSLLFFFSLLFPFADEARDDGLIPNIAALDRRLSPRFSFPTTSPTALAAAVEEDVDALLSLSSLFFSFFSFVGVGRNDPD
mmetsp:Transcript_46867/g.120774  ORF Transcript_46867/g.120774 Transcript_46867/m.120774 type:complete len:236 (-) Transcript_46867:886-1593(-)